MVALHNAPWNGRESDYMGYLSQKKQKKTLEEPTLYLVTELYFGLPKISNFAGAANSRSF